MTRGKINSSDNLQASDDRRRDLKGYIQIFCIRISTISPGRTHRPEGLKFRYRQALVADY